MNLRDKVEQLEQKLADSAARHACAVVEAKREAEQKFTDIVQVCRRLPHHERSLFPIGLVARLGYAPGHAFPFFS